MPAFWLRTGTFQELKINLWQAGSCKSLQQSEEGGGFRGGGRTPYGAHQHVGQCLVWKLPPPSVN